MQSMLTPPALNITTMQPAADGSLRPCPELEVAVRTEVTADGMLLQRLQLLGCQEAAQVHSGLALFQPGESSSYPTARQAQARPSQMGLPIAEVYVCVSLAAGGDQFEPQAFPLQLRPGAPQSLRLLPGNPWQGEDGSMDQCMRSGDPMVALQHKELLPPFSVQAFDAWGCPTGPGEHLHFRLLIECPMLSPARQEVEFSPMGVASVSGLVSAATAPAPEGGTAELRLSLVPAPATTGAEAAFAAAGKVEVLT